MDKQFKSVAAKLHFKPTVAGTTAVNESADISYINEAVAGGAKAILYTDLDPATFKSTVLKAEKAGVVMITIGAVDNISTYSVGTDNVAYAKKSVDVIAQKAGKNARVVLFATNLTVPNQAIQYHTFVSYAKQKYPHMQLLAEESDSADSGTAAADIRSVIEGYPNVNAFWMIEDASGPIIGKALQEAGKKPGQVFVLGIDALAGTLTEVQDGWVPELLNQCWFSSMPFASELALGKMAGHGLNAAVDQHPCATGDQGDPALQRLPCLLLPEGAGRALCDTLRLLSGLAMTKGGRFWAIGTRQKLSVGPRHKRE